MLRSRWNRVVLVLGCLLYGALPANPQDPAPARAAPEQPIPFSHKAHAAAGLQCQDCHPMKPPGNFVGLPATDTCMTCHTSIKAESPAIQELARFANEGRPVPWVRVYRVPNVVYFSHVVHHREAGFECSVCHGPVAERDVIALERPTSMAECMKCHDQHGASNDCDLCHDSF